MEENKKIENLVNIEKSSKKENSSADGTAKRKPFKKKKFNNHLRNNQKKEKFVIPYDDENETVSSPPKPIYNELFYFLRQKFSYNKTSFFELLDDALKVIEIKDIKEGNMTLFSYAAMYEKTEIFLELANRYPEELNKKDFENYIIPVCLNKNEQTLSAVIEVLNKNISLDDIFIKEIMSKIAKMSYRDSNNTLVLNWLSNKLTPELINVFWNVTLSEKNISLTNTALNNPLLKLYLRDNFENFSSIIDKMGKKIEITRKLSIIESLQNISDTPVKIIDIHKEPKIYLGDKEEQIQHLTKEDVATKVVIKRRKIVA